MDKYGACISRNVRTVSLVVMAIDDFTGRQITGSNARVWIEGEKPPIKKSDGWFVFVNLPEGEYTVNAEGGVYNKLSCQCKVSLEEYATLMVRLSPNSIYPIPSGTTCIEGKAGAGELVKAYISDKNSAFKLLSDVKKGDSTIGIYHPEGLDIEGKLLLVVSPDKDEEYIRVSGCEKNAELVYKLTSPMKKSYAKIGTLIFAVSEVNADEHGSFFIPVRSAVKDKSKCVCTAFGDKEITVTAEVNSGKRTRIDFTDKKK